MKVKFEKCNEKIFIPNGFTPNGDGLNDIFRPQQTFGITQYKMKIYNRLGQVVFKSEDASKGWNGILKGESLPQDVYIWVVRYKSFTGKWYDLKGTITLIR